MSSQATAIIDVGTPPPTTLNLEKLFTFNFHNFESLDSTKGTFVISPSIKCFDHEWAVTLYPGGDKNARDGMVSLFLRKTTKGSIAVEFALIIRDNEVTNNRTTDEFSDNVPEWGYSDLLDRSLILSPSINMLNNGTLTIELRMKSDESKLCSNLIPKNPCSTDLISLLKHNEKSPSDITFHVEVISAEKKSYKRYHAHRALLEKFAPSLASLSESYDNTNPMVVSGVDRIIFGAVLRYVYGNSLNNVDWEKESKNLIDAADRFGVTTLKIEAEVRHLKYCSKFTVDNAVDTFLYADSKQCALLKEAATNFILENAVDILKSDAFKSMPGDKSLMSEILMGVARNKKQRSGAKPNDYEAMSVNELRVRLYDRKLDIDGSREMLVARLKGVANERKSEEMSNNDAEAS
ncbi:predicted protein [Thalassiosira pseudonana CCMP1335]|uniref:BTB domain-containing protein n=1 Tax=Thalassiosira pseudonana TaxID=35128 RepID=B8C4R2_THAPS|nr:predicted protein [Thalassiosira pseudonana CCMP1335]EED91771.1 predicted protein [Thalassiosira pseudonana CCMP1335]